jgi:hypothetical protein
VVVHGFSETDSKVAKVVACLALEAGAGFADHGVALSFAIPVNADPGTVT